MKLYTLSEAAEVAGVRYEAMTRLIRLGRYTPTTRIGERYYLTGPEVERLGEIVRSLKPGRPRINSIPLL